MYLRETDMMGGGGEGEGEAGSRPVHHPCAYTVLGLYGSQEKKKKKKNIAIAKMFSEVFKI